VTVEFELANTGSRAGAEVAQIYVQEASPSLLRPLKELKGFKKVFLQPVKNKTSPSSSTGTLCPLRPGQKSLGGRQGAYQILVGSSSRDLLLAAIQTGGNNGEK